MAVAGFNVVLIGKEDQFISIRAVASCYGVLAQDWRFLCRHQQEEEDVNRHPL